MKCKIKPIGLSAFILVSMLTYPVGSGAYVDPNTGGFFFTSVLPFVYGILATLVVFWKRIANVIKNIFSKKKDSSGS